MTADFPCGEGTKHLVRTAMRLVLNSFTHVRWFSFTDASTVPCKEGMDISLANLSIAMNGQAYYEKYFSAYLKNESIRQEYIVLSRNINSPEKKMTFEEFVKFQDDALPIDTINIIKPLYESSPTMQQFFTKLRDECKKKKTIFCMLVYPWLNKYVDFMLQQKTHHFWTQSWIIDEESVPSVAFHMTEIPAMAQEDYLKHYMQGGHKQIASNGSLGMEEFG